MKVNTILVKPLDGYPIGSPRAFDKADFERLKKLGAVREAGAKDAIEEPESDEARLLERFRHPIDGPLLFAEMTARWDGVTTELKDLREQLAASNAERDAASADVVALRSQLQAAEADRDQAACDRDAARADLAAVRTEVDHREGEATAETDTPAPRAGKAKSGA